MRPLSPHLQIYKLPLTALLSILHRMTGVLLFLGLIVLIVVLATAAWDAPGYATLQALLSHWLGQLFLFGWTAALYLHLCNGIRHLFWDAGWGFTLQRTQQSAYITIAATLLLTAATWSLAYWM